MTLEPETDPSHFTGSNFDPELSIKEIAKRVRSDIRSLIKKGELPPVKVSVTFKRFTAGQRSLEVFLSEVPRDFKVTDKDRHRDSVTLKTSFGYAHPYARLTFEVVEIVKKLQQVVDSYNFDRSDTMSDYWRVNFYTKVGIDSKLVSG